jgi:hypothetical protein
MVRYLVILALTFGSVGSARELLIKVDEEPPPVSYALGKLERILLPRGDRLERTNGEADLEVRCKNGTVGPDGFTVTRNGRGLVVDGRGPRGAMYGVLDVAEQIRLGTPLERIAEARVSPPMGFRALKFNLPFAAYRTSLALEQHAAVCKDLNFWESFLDMMAENRFNALTLWSLHPFHYLVRSRSFPEACPFSESEMAEWRQLWKGILAMAKERAIETYILNWNIFVSPEFARAHSVARWSESWSHYGPDAATNEIVIRYTRESVTQVIDEYPDLTGLGVTLGERMGGMTPEARREWLDQTFFAGIADAKRPIKFIYRAPLSSNTGSGGATSEENDRRTRSQIERLTNHIIAPVLVEFKHNWSHAHSSPDLFIVHGGKLSDAYWNPPPANHKVVWTMRNEDLFLLRWGQPDFVREFERGKRQDYVGGAIIGSECYIPALDYLSKAGPHKTGRYAFERQWLFYAVWGRVLFDPATPDSRFEAMLDHRFGRGTGRDLLSAWKLASRIPLHFASFHRGEWDGSLYTEGFSSWRDNAERRFFDINTFITHPVLDTKRYLNIADFVRTGQAPQGVYTPEDLAQVLDRTTAAAAALVDGFRDARARNPGLDCELTDIEAWCAFGEYFAAKLRAGVSLATARARNDASRQQSAIDHLQKGVAHWKRLAELGAKFNQLPVPSNTKEPFSWAALLPDVERDIELAKAPLSEKKP